MDLQLRGKRALVTGSTGGIGLAIAKVLAREGASVAVNGRTEKRVAEALASIRRDVPDASLTAVVADLSMAEGAECGHAGDPGCGHSCQQPGHLRRQALLRDRRRRVVPLLRDQRDERRAAQPGLSAGHARAELGPDRVHLQRVGDEHPRRDDPLRHDEDGPACHLAGAGRDDGRNRRHRELRVAWPDPLRRR